MEGKLKIFLKKNKGSTTNILETDQSNCSSSDVNGAESIELNSQVTTSASVEIRIEESQQTSDNLMRKETNEENGIRNILIIGKTGNRKSTLANVLVDNNEFPEGKYRVNETKEVRSKEFKIEGIKNRVVDTVTRRP
ncbi:hypothetical protein RhiirA5_473617 [Rhizophagus irregularis]|uniref:AIG1-type G domain-containing protein n=1 Tax=Rhizophagus irregularis TaxID=588596 RepID=A0A2N0NMG2_9GLOM|nr:hypothetical protein RhiirA5_473617 [Rhizophagus irregularis]